ncbi:hypothetical protein Dimus_012981 [Dionaea muscipula]
MVMSIRSSRRGISLDSMKVDLADRFSFVFLDRISAQSIEAAAIGGVARKREDLIIVNIDEASGDDELAVVEYAEDIYKFYKLTELYVSRADGFVSDEMRIPTP